MIAHGAPLALAAVLGRRRSEAGAVDTAWALFASALRPPYETQACLAAALEALAHIAPAEAYLAYASDAPGQGLTLRAARAPSGVPVVGPDYSGLVTGALIQAVPLDLPPPESERPVLEGAAREPLLTVPVGGRVVLRAALSPRGRRLGPRLLEPSALLAARLRPVLELALHRADADGAAPAGGRSASALLLAMPPERSLDLLCRLGAEALGASDGYLALWAGEAAAPSIAWTGGDAAGLMGDCPPESLRGWLDPPRVAGWRAPALPGALGARGYSGFVCIPVRPGARSAGVLALGLDQPPLAPASIAGRIARVLSAVLAERERAAHLAQGRLATLLGISDLLEACDEHLAGHSARVARLAEEIAREMGLLPPDREAARLAGRLHDLGMVGVGLALPLRRGALTDAERARVRQHPVIAAELLRALPAEVVPAEAVLAVRHHHERWDGRGYPDGLAGKAIPELARILACAEVMVARTSARSYRAPLDMPAALRALQAASGTEFDPEVAAAAARVLSRGGAP